MTRRKIIRIGEVLHLCGVSTPTIYRWVKNPRSTFPRPMKLGPNTVGWFEDEILAWLETRQKGGIPGDSKDAAKPPVKLQARSQFPWFKVVPGNGEISVFGDAGNPIWVLSPREAIELSSALAAAALSAAEAVQ